MKCVERTKAGRPCKNTAMAGSDLCVAHLRRVGRKTKMTEELTVSMVGLLRGGVPVSTAIAACGLGRSTYDDWRRDLRPEYVRFGERIDEARALGEATLVSRIQAATPESWQAAAWLLERTVPETYARLSQRVLVEPPGQPENPFKEFVPSDELAARRDKA